MIYSHYAVNMVLKLRIIQIWPQDEYFGSVFNRDDVKQGCVANGNMRMEMELTTSKVDTKL